MLILKNKEGFTLIEVMCSLAIFSIIFLGALTMELQAVRLRKYNKGLYKNATLIEMIKNNLIGNTSYDELKSLGEGNKIYINKDDIDFNKMKNTPIYACASSQLNSSEPYVKLNITQGNVIEAEVELHIIINGERDILKCKVYKGSYN